MNSSELHKNYFTPDSRGYKILRKFYSKYSDLFEKSSYPEFNDFLNQIYLNITRIDFNSEIENKEAYIIGAIKIQCRVQLDKVFKHKYHFVPETKNIDDEGNNVSIFENIKSENNNPVESYEGQEIFNTINIFKLKLKISEKQLLNYLIDETPRKEIADIQKINMNTLDTKIRRLRIKLFNYLKDSGYSLLKQKKFERNK